MLPGGDLLYGPAVAVGVAEVDEGAPIEDLDVTDPEPTPAERR